MPAQAPREPPARAPGSRPRDAAWGAAQARPLLDAAAFAAGKVLFFAVAADNELKAVAKAIADAGATADKAGAITYEQEQGCFGQLSWFILAARTATWGDVTMQ